ncbi:MAG: DUF3987 domain-containing protein, partial [Proteobacteria bacterium]
GPKRSMRCDDDHGLFYCRSMDCPQSGREFSVLEFYLALTGNEPETAIEIFRKADSETSGHEQVSNSRRFESPGSCLDHILSEHPTLELTHSFSWLDEDCSTQKIVYVFNRSGNETEAFASQVTFKLYRYEDCWNFFNHSKAKDFLPYGWHELSQDKQIVVARDESERDYLYSLGFNVIAVSSTGAWESYFAKLFLKKDLVYLARKHDDGDQNVKKAKKDLRSLASFLRPLYLESPNLAEFSIEELTNLIGNAKDALRSWKQPKRSLKSFELIPDFDPEEMLPESFRYHLEEQAEDLQVPISSLGATALAAASNLIGRKLLLQPKPNPGYRVPAPVWCMVIADPGQKKTQILNVALAPLEAIEKAKADSNALILARRAATLKTLGIQERELENRHGKAFTARKIEEMDGVKEELISLERVRNEILNTGPEQHIVRDSTPEKLMEILVQNPNGVVIRAEEIPAFFRTLKTATIDYRKILLEGSSGVDVNLQRKAYTLKGTSIVSLIGGAQPDWAKKVVNDLHNGIENDGLINRFGLLLYHENPVDDWRYCDREFNKDAAEYFHRTFLALDHLRASDIFPDDDQRNWLRFTPEAQEVFIKWLTKKEKQIRKDGFSSILKAQIAKYTSLYCSLSLIFHLIFVIEESIQEKGAVGIESVNLAERWCDYLYAHARKIFLNLKSHPSPARKLAKLIRLGSVRDCMSLHEILAGSHEHLESAAELREAIDYLSDDNILSIDKLDDVETLRINPLTFKGNGPCISNVR